MYFMPQSFIRYKKIIDAYLLRFLSEKQKELSSVNSWSDDIFQKLNEFVTSGKSLRGGFVLFITDIYGKKINDDALRLASAVELIHAGFLIHDDIMDQDRMRRGHPSLYTQYEEVGKKLTFNKPLLFGQDMAICAGDLTFFLAMSCLGQNTNSKKLPLLLNHFSSEYSSVCVAQMQDASFGFSYRIPTIDEVLSLYRYKTARYTFSMPFMLGGILAGITKKEITTLEKLGEQMGIIFQLHDDSLNLFGNPQITGKPVGSDIREGKKTLALVRLFTHAGNLDRQKLQAIMKRNKRNPKDVTLVYQLLEKYQIKTYLETEILTIANNATQFISNLSVEEHFKKDMTDVLKYIYERSK